MIRTVHGTRGLFLHNDPDNLTNTMDGHGAFFKSWESDCSFFDGCHPWFCCGKVQDINTTMSHWESSYGRGTNYILNVPPSPNGEIEPALVEASKNFRLERERPGLLGRRLRDHESPC